MKKNLFTLLFMAVALFSAATMVSCGDDDDENGGGSSAEARKIYVFDNGYQNLNRQYKLIVGSETKILKIDDLKKETVAPSDVESKASVAVSESKSKGETVTIYSYDIPSTMHGDAVLKSDFSIKDGVEASESVRILIGGFFCVGNEYSGAVRGTASYMSLQRDAAKEYIDKKNATNIASITLK